MTVNEMKEYMRQIALGNTYRLNVKRKAYLKHKYPYELVTGNYKDTRLSPDKVFKEYVPGLVFAALPLEDGVHWFFSNKEDKQLFINMLIRYKQFGIETVKQIAQR